MIKPCSLSRSQCSSLFTLSSSTSLPPSRRQGGHSRVFLGLFVFFVVALLRRLPPPNSCWIKVRNWSRKSCFMYACLHNGWKVGQSSHSHIMATKQLSTFLEKQQQRQQQQWNHPAKAPWTQCNMSVGLMSRRVEIKLPDRFVPRKSFSGIFWLCLGVETILLACGLYYGTDLSQ